MADPKDLAAQLEAFNQIEAQGQPWYKKQLPMDGRATFLPYRDTLEGSIFNQRELAMPGILAGALNAFSSPERARTGSDPTFNPNEEAINFAQNVMGGGVGTSAAMKAPTGQGGKDLAMNAWHGTPHEIEGNFSLGKVGTGEGNQAYGHGIYYAENPEVAKSYALSTSKTTSPDTYSIENIANRLYKGGFDDEFIKNRIKSAIPNATDDLIKKGMDLAKLDKPAGNLYKVDIPDAQIPMMLDWDKPLNQQPKEIQKWLSDPYNPYKKQLLEKDSGGNEPYGKDLYNRLANLMSEGKGWDIGNKNASQELNSFGITGIRYLDEGSRSQSKGSSNFVVFKPETVKILEKNGQPTRKELLQQEFDKLDK